MQATMPQVRLFGKLPAHGDFVRYNVGGTALQALDVWLQEGLHLARLKLNTAFEQAYEAASARYFVFSAGGGAPLLVGVLCPSQDRAGRKYPLLIVLEALPEWGNGSLEELPAALGGFLDEAAAFAGEAVAGERQPVEAASRLDSLAVLPASSAYRDFLKETSMQALWKELYGDSEDERKYLLLENLVDILLPHRGHEPRIAYGLEFPLSSDRQMLHLTASFWLDVCLRLLRFPVLSPTFFWGVPDQAADRAPFLLLFFCLPAAGALMHLLPAGVESESVCRLDEMSRQQAVPAVAEGLTEEYRAMLQDETLTLWDFLQRI